MTDFLTPAEAAKKIGRSESALRTMRARGIGPAYHKQGARVLYAIADLESWKNVAIVRVEPKPKTKNPRKSIAKKIEARIKSTRAKSRNK